MTRKLSTAKRFAVCTAILIAPGFLGCEKPSRFDRADYSADDRRTPVEATEEQPAARRRPAKATEAPLRFTEASAAARRPVHHSETQAIATPIPDRIVSTAEAENPARYASYSSGAPLPQSNPNSSAIDADAKFRQAEEHCRRGASAAARGTWFTARADFEQAARLLALALDAREGLTRRAEALEIAMVALNEAEEFVKFATGATPASAMPVVVRGHQTMPRLQIHPQSTPAALHDAYCRFAERQLVEAFTGCEPASVALHGLGKVHAAAGTALVDSNSKARCFYEAAISVAPGNCLAANDLGVLLADEGRLAQARDVLHAGLRNAAQPAMWKNLAVIHDRMGQAELARLARQEAAKLEQLAAATPGAVLPTHNVHWLDARGFAAMGRPPVDAQVASPTASTVRSSNGSGVTQASASTNVPSRQQPIEKTARQVRTPALAY